MKPFIFILTTVVFSSFLAEVHSAENISETLRVQQAKAKVLELNSQITSLGTEIEGQIDTAVNTLIGITDSKDSGMRVARMKTDIIDFLRKQLSDYSRRRAQIRAEMESPRRVLPETTLASDIDIIDARIEKRIGQITALGGSFATHQDFDKYNVIETDRWWGDTKLRINEDYVQNKKETTVGDQEKGKLVDALDEAIKRLEFKNRSIESQIVSQPPEVAARSQSDIMRNLALIDVLKGKASSLLTAENPPTKEIGAKEANTLSKTLNEAGENLRREQFKLIGLYNEFNQARATVATLDPQ